MSDTLTLIYVSLTFTFERILGVVCLLHNVCTSYTNTADVNMARLMPGILLPKYYVGMHHIVLQI